jgi:hypothetical protein
MMIASIVLSKDITKTAYLMNMVWYRLTDRLCRICGNFPDEVGSYLAVHHFLSKVAW